MEVIMVAVAGRTDDARVLPDRKFPRVMSEALMVRFVCDALAKAVDRDPRLGVILREDDEPHRVAAVHVELRDKGLCLYLYLTGTEAPIFLRGDNLKRPALVRDIRILEEVSMLPM